MKKENRFDTGVNMVSRQSGIELLRIVMMLIIIAHHYVVNSGLLDKISNNMMSVRSIFLLILGWGGKYAINCFILITGYFMCTQQITLKKFLKLLAEIEFYNICIYVIFLVTGYIRYSFKDMLHALLPVYAIGSGFTTSYLVLFLLIPYLNILIRGMNEKWHIRLIMVCVGVFTLLPSCLKADINVKFGYVGWFMIVYIIAAYLRLYPKELFDNNRICGMAMVFLLILSWGSVVACAWLSNRQGTQLYYFFVNDSNKILALLPATATFLYFKNLKLGYCKWINNIAATTLGVLMIHANNDAMRQWLWQDMLRNVYMYESDYLFVHAVLSVFGVYIICVFIDLLRIRFVERPIFKS